jgi:hypothetical protein
MGGDKGFHLKRLELREFRVRMSGREGYSKLEGRDRYYENYIGHCPYQKNSTIK